MSTQRMLWWAILIGVLLGLTMGFFGEDGNAFSMPPDEDGSYRNLQSNELRFYRKSVAKVNRLPGYLVTSDQKLWVPNDPTKYEDWTPVKSYYEEYKEKPKVILIILNEFFLGRLEYGQLVDWDVISAGYDTKPGSYKVLEKDQSHASRSYQMDDGVTPVPMPWALRVYGTIWIHGGWLNDRPADLSHGCIRLTLRQAEDLFNWAEVGTPVEIKK